VRYSTDMTMMIENPAWTLVDRLKYARLLAGLEQAEIAARLGVARTTVSAWETGRTEPSATNFVRWAHVTGQPLEWLAEGVNDETPAEAGAASTVSTSVRPEGFEPPTF
jgi:transcriptional regulator with XRE-family HTH domain